MLAVLRYGTGSVDLTMAVNPVGAGTTVPSVGTSSALPSTPQAISATANSSYAFVNWTTSGTEAIISDPNAASTSVSLTGSATVTANFSLAYVVNPSVTGNGSISPSTDQSAAPGTTVQFTLTPTGNHHLIDVAGTCPGGVLLDNGNGTWQYTTGQIADNCTVIANFGFQGDVNLNGIVDLTDIILALQVIAGIVPVDAIGNDADVNGDDKIGMAEAIYVMQKVAGLR
jgi:hypothetical protein